MNRQRLSFLSFICAASTCSFLVGTLGSTVVLVAAEAEEASAPVDRKRRRESFLRALGVASTFQRAADLIKGASAAAEEKDDGNDQQQLLRRLANEPMTCEEELARLKAEAGQPSYLFVQMADACALVRYDDGKKFLLKSRHFHETTTLFSDRPMQIEEEMKTADFFDEFDEIFDEKSGGKPNAAFTFVQDDESSDVLVSVAIKAVNKQDKSGEDTFVYKLEQSEEQESLLPLSSFFGDGNDNDEKVVLDHCSIFVDSYQRRRPIPCSPNQVALGEYCKNDNWCCSGICSDEGKCSQMAGFPCPKGKPNSADSLCSSGSCDEYTLCAEP